MEAQVQQGLVEVTLRLTPGDAERLLLHLERAATRPGYGDARHMPWSPWLEDEALKLVAQQLREQGIA